MIEKINNTKENKEQWISPTNGIITFDKMINYIKDYTDINNPENDGIKLFSIVTATDSQRHGRRYKFTTSITVRRMLDNTHGRGGIYYIKNEYFSHMGSIKQKIITEAGITVLVSNQLEESLKDIVLKLVGYNVEVDFNEHYDISRTGGSKVALKDVLSIASATGHNYCIKPNSWAASGVSNKHSK